MSKNEILKDFIFQKTKRVFANKYSKNEFSKIVCYRKKNLFFDSTKIAFFCQHILGLIVDKKNAEKCRTILL